MEGQEWGFHAHGHGQSATVHAAVGKGGWEPSNVNVVLRKEGDVRQVQWCRRLRAAQALSKAEVSSQLPRRVLQSCTGHRDISTKCPSATIIRCTSPHDIDQPYALSVYQANAPFTWRASRART
jgi:hypothetical protein